MSIKCTKSLVWPPSNSAYADLGWTSEHSPACPDKSGTIYRLALLPLILPFNYPLATSYQKWHMSKMSERCWLCFIICGLLLWQFKQQTYKTREHDCQTTYLQWHVNAHKRQEGSKMSSGEHSWEAASNTPNGSWLTRKPWKGREKNGTEDGSPFKKAWERKWVPKLYTAVPHGKYLGSLWVHICIKVFFGD